MLEAYIDGSSRGNPGPGGYGVVCINDMHQRIEIGGYEAHTTNNRMELQAVIAAIGLVEPYLSLSPTNQYTLHSDSTYVVQGIKSWLSGWKRKGWITASKDPVMNVDLWKHIDTYVERYGGQIQVEKVLGHSGVELNERADVIATSFALRKDIVLEKQFTLI